MGKEQLAVSREWSGSRTPRPANTPPGPRLTEDSPPPHPLSVLALASSIRLDDPRLEHERVVMLEVAIVAGREAARAFDRWLSQALAEYRGSRTTWDLEATTAELRLARDRFDETLRETADRLITLIPNLMDGVPGFAPSPASRPSRRRGLDEVAAVSGLLGTIEPRNINGTLRRDRNMG